ncbi:azurin blue-copper protein [Thiorhodococcus drewsii AZ1]|uniref:Azurin n=1 Tax=Thiorhodococcus drewsii AZ1 TaxID=765913 RepID=G2DZC4_9GAMM|nr:azurin [Thiorhodococcus drewsii]EGV32151.1 azurin blue-copper protein [Thiorhodococcus drewsii AZ1]
MKSSAILLASMLAAGASWVYADCEFTIDVNDTMTYPIAQIVADSSCEAIKVTVTHKGTLDANVMGHNWVLAKTDDVQAIATEGMMAGADNNYLKPGDTRVLAHTDIVGAGATSSTSFSPSLLEAGQSYDFFCSFPGHWASMRGKFVLE